ncbi:MAG: c-type cytochrome [Burkholderiaceae bacterium]
MRIGVVAIVLACAAWLAGCAVEFENTKAAQELEARSRPAGSVYLGWRVFEDKCARCHGSSGAGQRAKDAPDLLARMRTLGPREFADLVLLRYEWAAPGSPSAAPASAEREAYLDDLVQRRKGAVVMPAWQGEPRVTAHVIDVYAYLAARSEGTQGPGRPAGP